jgi:class 3 adenylate cyclase
MEPRIQYAKTSDGVSIAYATLGEGPPIIFATRVWGDSHLYASVEQFRPYYGALAQRGWRVIFYDGRGMGSSQRDVTGLGLDERILDLDAVVGAAGSDRLALCGTQSGGPAAIAYSVQHPERVSHLGLVNTFARGADYFESIPSLRVAKDLSHIAEDQWEFYSLAVANALTAFSDIETARRLAAAIRAGTSPRAFVADRDAIEQMDLTDALSSVAVPTLVIHDRSDTIGDFSALASKLASRIPGARFIATDDAARAIDEFLREGEPSGEPTLPSGTAVILFADIADSTALTERLGDGAFRDKARELDEALRRAISSDKGSAIDGKLLGDGVLATFGAAREAIACAGAIHAAGSHAGLPLHIGIHAGDVIRESNNVYGGAVNIASRISGEAAAGETLVSATVRELARTSAGVSFEDRGEHELKGVAEPQRLFAVREG